MDKTDLVLLASKSVQAPRPIAESMVIPNLSGDLSRGNVLETPTQDLDPVNKKYVDGVIVSHSHVLSDGATDVTATATQVNSLVGDGMVDSLHRHSELSASDGTPNPALSVDAAGYVGIGTTGPEDKLTLDGTDPVATIRSGGYLKLRPTANDWDMRLGTGGLASAMYMGIFSGGDLTNPRMVVTGPGNVGIGITSPTAKLHLPACAAAANKASLKIDAGTLATTAVSGNIESDGTHLYWTDSGGTRKQLD